MLRKEQYLVKELSFDAAHFVHTAGKDSPCRFIHGHTWKVIVSLAGEMRKDGMIIDFRLLKKVIDKYDHKIILPSQLCTKINAVEGMVSIQTDTFFGEFNIKGVKFIDSISSTAENIANEILKDILNKGNQEGYKITMIDVEVFESPTASVQSCWSDMSDGDD